MGGSVPAVAIPVDKGLARGNHHRVKFIGKHRANEAGAQRFFAGRPGQRSSPKEPSAGGCHGRMGDL